MHPIKKIFNDATGYWIHKRSTLPVGTDLFVDIHRRINFDPLKTVFDIGANFGQTWQWIRSNEAEAKIYCFEPVLETFKVLEATTKKDRKCIVENIAFGNSPGTKKIKLFTPEFSALNSLKDELMNNDLSSAEETVKIDTIDRYCTKHQIRHIDFLKIDTEGYELQILEGAQVLLATAGVTFIYCEVGFLRSNRRNTNFSDLAEWLASRGYLFYGLYQLINNGVKGKDCFGNALFLHEGLLQPG